MRQRLIIIVTLIAVVVVLVLLNAASYVKVEATPDTEIWPDRSTYNAGPTGTRALYDFLHESGYDVTRWRESTASLLNSSGPKPASLVVIGDTKIAFTKVESKEILLWVDSGGRLVIIDRSPQRMLLPQSGAWEVHALMSNFPWNDLDPTDFEAMTKEVKAIAPSQPTAFGRNIETIMPSRFASALTFVRATPVKKGKHSNSNSAESDESSDDDESDFDPEPKVEISTSPENASGISPAPIASFINERGAVVAEYPHGKGRIVLVSDPYLVANNGINRADNLQLAINVVVGNGGVID